MSEKCPNCGFEPVDGLATCPNCGIALTKTNETPSETPEDTENQHKNDDIQWSDYAEMPIETVMEKMNEDLQEETPPETPEISETPETEEQAEVTATPDGETDPDLLAAYIRSHKKEDTEDSAENEIAEKKEPVDEKENSESDSDSATPETSETPAVETGDEEVTPTASDAKTPTTEEAVPEAEVEPTADNNQSAKEEESEPAIDKESAFGVPTTFYDEKTEEAKGPTADSENEVAKSDESNQDNKKKLYITLAAVAVLGIGGWGIYSHQQNLAAQRAEEVRQVADLADIQGSIDDFYLDTNQEFVSVNAVDKDTTKIQQSLATLKNAEGYQDVADSLDSLVSKISTIKEVNSYFKEPIINGDRLAEKPLLKKDQAVTMAELSADTDFGKLINEARGEATEQYETLQTAKKETEKVYKDGKVVKDVTRKAYNTAFSAVKKVKNQDLVTEEKKALEKVNEELNKQEKAENAENTAQTQAQSASEAAATDVASGGNTNTASNENNGSSSTSGTTTSQSGRTVEIAPGFFVEKNSNNQPVLPEIASQVADTGNAAWNWNEGIKEKVLAICKERGYIVEGGYVLKPAQIVNGEGYYNLYATNNKSPLLKGIDESAFPLYLVSINCKTGYFIGNGNDQTQ